MIEIKARAPFGVSGALNDRHGRAHAALLERGAILVKTRKHIQSSVDALTQATGLPAPSGPAFGEADGVYWLPLSPREWLVLASEEQIERMLPVLEAALGTTGTAINYTDALAVFLLEGPSIHELLSAGCTLDRSALRSDSVYRTRFARVGATIVYETAERMLLITVRSHAHYVWEWLEQTLQKLESA